MSWSAARIGVAVVALSGVAAGFAVNVARALQSSQNVADVLANYFSLFTIVSSVATAAMLLIANRHLRRGAGAEPLWVGIGLATTTAAMIILGVVFNVLLRGADATIGALDTPLVAALDRWATESLHVVIPVYVAVDVIFGPQRRRLSWGALGAIVGIPMIWAAYTMVRGTLVAAPDGTAPYWYPYGFLDPHGPTGYASPLIYIAAIATGFLAVGALLVLLSHRRHPFQPGRALRGGHGGTRRRTGRVRRTTAVAPFLAVVLTGCGGGVPATW